MGQFMEVPLKGPNLIYKVLLLFKIFMNRTGKVWRKRPRHKGQLQVFDSGRQRLLSDRLVVATTPHLKATAGVY